MVSWEPVDIDRDEITDEDVKWDDDVMKDLEIRLINKENLMKLWMKVPTRIL